MVDSPFNLKFDIEFDRSNTNQFIAKCIEKAEL